MTGLRAHEWMRQLRQSEAVLLLGKLGSVKATAFQLGYKQPSHFSVQFKSFHGISPSEFLSDENVAFSNQMSDFHIPLDFAVRLARVENGGRKGERRTRTAQSENKKPQFKRKR
jgi:AraC-like DNA-binding protein